MVRTTTGEAKTFTIECVSQTPGSKEMFPQSNHLRWKFGARGGMPPVTLNSYDSDWPKDVKAMLYDLRDRVDGTEFGVNARLASPRISIFFFARSARTLPPKASRITLWLR